MAHCLWHGIEYQGGPCPRCLQEKMLREHEKEIERITEEETRQRGEQAEALAKQIEAASLEAQIQMDMRLRAAAEEQQKSIAQAPRLQARALGERAYELYKVGLYEDAFQTSLKAIELDRGNIYATEIAAWALMKQGRQPVAKAYFEKQLALLNTPDYMNSPDWFRSVLVGLPNDDAFLRAFCDALRRNSNRWNSSADCFDLIDALMDRKLIEDAKVLTETLIKRNDSLTLQAYLLEISKHAGKPSSEKLEAFLQAIPLDRRLDLLGSFQVTINRKSQVSATTVSRIKEAISQSYDRWKPQIENDIYEGAIREAKSVKSGKAWGWTLAVASYILFAFVLPLSYEPITGNRIIRPEQVINFLFQFSLLPTIFIGAWGGYIIGRIRRSAYAQRRIDALERQEHDLWRSTGATLISVRRPSRLFIVIGVIILLAGIGLLLVSEFDYLSGGLNMAPTPAPEAMSTQQIQITDTEWTELTVPSCFSFTISSPINIRIRLTDGSEFLGLPTKKAFVGSGIISDTLKRVPGAKAIPKEDPRHPIVGHLPVDVIGDIPLDPRDPTRGVLYLRTASGSTQVQVSMNRMKRQGCP